MSQTDSSTARSPSAADPAHDFSIVLGGPLYQLFLRSRLAKPPLDLLRRRVLVIPLLTWAPPLVLSVLERQAFGGVRLPFLQDLEAQARFLLALPLLILAEAVVHRRLAPALSLFIEKGLVRPADRARFEAIVASTMRLRNSVAIQVVLLAFVLTAGHQLWREQVAVQDDSWYAVQTAQGLTLSLAGRCYAWFSLPVFQFILLRWFYRIFLWAQLLWRVSRLELQLAPGHPDRAGGLGFLGVSTYAFVPLLVFVPGIVAAKRRGLRQYGLLADRYVREFEGKWLLGGAAPDEALLGSADIQSLADLGNGFSVVSTMRPVPFGKETLLWLLAVTALPLLPLGLTVVPLDELIRRALGVLL